MISPDVLIAAVDDRVSSVRTQSFDFSFNEIADMYESEELVIQPDFQRMFRWSVGAQSRFIESLLLELPIPPIFLIELEDRVYELIDGLQRISSYLHFRGVLPDPDGRVREPLVLEECDIVTELNGLDQSALPRSLDIKLKRSYVRAEILRKESDKRLRYHMFKRLNTGGEILSQQEVRNATIRLLSDDFNTFIIARSTFPDFRACISTVAEGQIDRRFDQELVLRFFAFKNDGDRYRHDLSDFLTDYMEAVSDPNDPMTFDEDAEQATFEKTFAVLQAVDVYLRYDGRIFGSVASGSQKPRGQFAVHHYEGLALGLQAVIDRVDPGASDTIAKVADVVHRGKSDPEFLRHIGPGKNDRVPYQGRVEYFRRAFADAL